MAGIDILQATGKAENLKEELGDLLLQVVFHARLAEEAGLFNLADVAKAASDKMERRHPHVFAHQKSADRDTPAEAEQHLMSAGAEQPQSTEQLSWDEIKRREKAGKEWMDAYLPDAMLEARELVDRARRRKGFLTETDV